MNKEVIKAMNKKQQNIKIQKAKKWWINNSHIVFRVILFPVWIITIINDKINHWLNSKKLWDKNRANEILNYYVPRYSDWGENTKTFHFFDNGMGWGNNTQYIKRKDRRFWKVNCWRIKTFLIEEFELEGFTKEIENTWDDWTEINFILISKNDEEE